MKWRLADLLPDWLRLKTTAQKHRQLRIDSLVKTAKQRRRKRVTP